MKIDKIQINENRKNTNKNRNDRKNNQMKINKTESLVLHIQLSPLDQ